MRIYLGTIGIHSRTGVGCTGVLVKAKDSEDAQLELEKHIARELLEKDGFYGPRIGPIEDVTDAIRQLLQEIDAA